MRRFILTGTPGSGKTALLRRLEIDGHAVVEEAATDVIALRQAEEIDEPWREPAVFFVRHQGFVRATEARRISA